MEPCAVLRWRGAVCGYFHVCDGPCICTAVGTPHRTTPHHTTPRHGARLARGSGRKLTCLFSHACGCAPPWSLSGTRETSPCPRPARCRTTWCPAPRVADASTKRLRSGTSPSARTSRPRQVDTSLAPVNFQPDTPHILIYARVHRRHVHLCASGDSRPAQVPSLPPTTFSHPPHCPYVPRLLTPPSRPALSAAPRPIHSHTGPCVPWATISRSFCCYGLLYLLHSWYP